MKTLKLFWNARRLLLLSVALSLPHSLLACAACYGKSDSPMAQGMNWGIFTLLGVITCVLMGVAAFFVHVGRRAARANAAAELKTTTTN